MLITKQKDLEAFCEQVRGAAYITVDTEFLREKNYYPKLCLVQIGDPDKNAAAIDPLAEGIDLSPVFDLFDDPNILKIFHAGRQDLEIFYNLTGRIPAPMFDTQIAAMVCGYGESAGYETLVRTITGAAIDKSSQFTKWAARPLTQKQIDYAIGDVTHLVDVYEALSQKLTDTKRTEWVLEENAILNNPATYAVDPQNAWKRVKLRSPKPKTLVILKALAAWREQRAQHKNLPKTWIMKDDTLAAIAHAAPRSPQELKKIRNLADSYSSGRNAQTILDCVKDALASDPKTWPSAPARKASNPEDVHIIEFLKFLLKMQAEAHDVAQKLIANKDDLVLLAESDDADIPAMRGWRYDVFGQHAKALKAGKLSLGLNGKTIVQYDVGE